MLNAEFPAQVKLRIDDNWLTQYATTEAYVDCRDLDGTRDGRRMRPRGILIGFNSSDTAAATATVKLVLWDEKHVHADTYDLACGVIHPLAVQFLYANGTNGRHIKIFG